MPPVRPLPHKDTPQDMGTGRVPQEAAVALDVVSREVLLVALLCLSTRLPTLLAAHMGRPILIPHRVRSPIILDQCKESHMKPKEKNQRQDEDDMQEGASW